MPAATNHVLICDSKDESVMFFAGLKRARHYPKPRIHHYDEVLQTGFTGIFQKSDPVPWKLHFIHHGQAGGLSHAIDIKKLATAVVSSKLHEQPSGGPLPKLRLDVCWSAIGPKKSGGSDPEARDPTGSVLNQLCRELADALPKGLKIEVEGVKGILVGPWNMDLDATDQVRGRRMVVNFQERTHGSKLVPFTATYKPISSTSVFKLYVNKDGSLRYWDTNDKKYKHIKPGFKFPLAPDPNWATKDRQPATPRHVLFYLSTWVRKNYTWGTKYTATKDGKQLALNADGAWKLMREANQAFYKELQSFPIFWKRGTGTEEKPFKIVKQVLGK